MKNETLTLEESSSKVQSSKIELLDKLDLDSLVSDDLGKLSTGVSDCCAPLNTDACQSAHHCD